MTGPAARGAEPVAPALPLTGATRWIVAATLLLGALAFAVSGRGTILPSDQIVQAFGLDGYRYQWITGPAAVVGLLAIFAPIYYVRVFGVRLLYVAGALCLGVGTLMTAAAREPWQMGLAQVVQATAGVMMLPGFGLMTQLFPEHRSAALSAFLGMLYGGQMVAEAVGGLMAFHPSWRAMFLGVSLVSAWLLTAGVVLFPPDRPATRPAHRFDTPGALLLASWMALVLFLLYRGSYLGWLDSTPVALAVGALAIVTVLFVWRELRAPEPFVDLTVFTFRTASLAMVAAAFFNASLYGVSIMLPRYMRELRGYPEAHAGAVILPAGVLMVASMLVGGVIARRGVKMVVLWLMLAGKTAETLWLSHIDLYTPWPWIMGVTALGGLCAGTSLALLVKLTFEGQTAAEAARTGAMKFFLRLFGGTAGTLAAGLLLVSSSTAALDSLRLGMLPGREPQARVERILRQHLTERGHEPAAAAALASALVGDRVSQHAQAIGYQTVLQYLAILNLLALALSLVISRRPEISTLDPPERA